MLVILTKDQVLLPQTVCQDCLLADREGKPRWDHGHLRCGREIEPNRGRHQFRCAMGFQLATVDE